MKPVKSISLIVSFMMLLLFSQCTEDKLSPDGTGSIKGTVFSETSSEPIVNAEVSTNPPTHTVLTDSTGNFLMEDVKVGDYNVIAKQKDHYSASVGVQVNFNATAQVIINLSERITDQELPWLSNKYYPADNMQNAPINITLSWQLEKESDSVDFSLKVFEAGGNVIENLENLTDTFSVITGLKFHTIYFWQVSAFNEAGMVYSEIRTFKTMNFPQNHVLFAKRVDGVAQIFITDTDTLTENNIQLTHNSYHSWRPVSNPQNTRIAFLSTKDIAPQLYTMDIDGGNVKKLTNIPTGGYYNKGVGFGWLPTGDKLVFSSYNKLYTINHDGSGLTLITTIPDDKHFREVDWSVNNEKILALTLGVDRYDAEIIIMNTDGSDMQVLVSDQDGALENPSFSIGGNHIIYTYDASGFQSGQGRQLDARIYRYNLQTDETTDLSTQKPNGTNDLQPYYTPDGARIIFVNTPNTLNARRDLYMINADGTSRKILASDVELPDWGMK